MAKQPRKPKEQKQNIFAFDKSNYIPMVIGFVVIIIGMILMAGGNNHDPLKFHYEIFSTRRLTIAPIIIMLGFVIELYAILKKPGQTKKEDKD
ncbi:MAG: DUF3098 domain-containing protein [Bacteroidota bacterium]|nr:DUF3098 domain-containing protein [Bacteroidota bacterium]